ncbi:MAG: fatty acid desaturase [Spirochaetales bacterium]
MSEAHQPMSEVRKTLKIEWYRCPVDRERFRALAKRSDFKGLLQAVGHLALLVATGALVVLLFERQMWVAMAFALWFHGVVFSFVPGLVTHELSHGTVFKSKWLNDLFLRVYSLIGWINFHHYKKSHTYHHMYTLHPQGDREVELPANPTIKGMRLVRLLTFNYRAFWDTLRAHFTLAFFGRFSGVHKPEWSETIFADDPEAKKRAVNWSRLVLLFQAVIWTAGVVLGIWILPVVASLSSFVAWWWRDYIGSTMHTGLRDNVPDWRKCARSIKLDPLSRFLYWNMNFHIEHHMYAAIPCYNLKKLRDEIAWDMPKQRTLLEARREMLEIYRRQQSDPSYQFDTPVPEHSERA